MSTNCCVKFVRGCNWLWPHLWGGAYRCGLSWRLARWENLHELQGTGKPTSFIQVTHTFLNLQHKLTPVWMENLWDSCNMYLKGYGMVWVVLPLGGDVITGKSNWWSSQMTTIAWWGGTWLSPSPDRRNTLGHTPAWPRTSTAQSSARRPGSRLDVSS